MLKLHHWLVCLLLMNVPLYGMLNSDKADFSEYKFYKNIVDERIQQGLKGADLIKPKDERDRCHLLERLVYADKSEDDSRYSDYSDLRQRIIDYDPEVKKLKRFYKAFLTCLFTHRVKQAQWFIAEGVNIDLRPGEALGNLFLGIDSWSVNQVIFIMRFLLIHNVDLNGQNEFGFTSLHSITEEKFLHEGDLCIITRSLIVGGADCSLKTYNNCGSGSKHNKKTAIEIARIEQKFQLASIIEQTALQRDSLFAAVARGENIPFGTANPKDPKELENWVSRCHARTIHGDSLLHCAFANDNLPVAQKLIKFWPQLLAQPNFKGETVLYLFPQRCIELLANLNSDL